MVEEISTTCCVVGGGPAGMMLGYLLARSGVDVVVLEKHGDFLRDFRGDTIHPSTLEIMHELGILDELLRISHSEIRQLHATLEGQRVTVADFSRLPTRCQFIAMMPQWDFLTFLGHKAAEFPGFHLYMNAGATDVIETNSVTRGVRARHGADELVVHADLVVACDGRDSDLRHRAGLPVKEHGAPMDVLWFRLSRHQGDPDEALGGLEAGQPFVLLLRPGHWQCAFIIPKGGADALRARGIEAFRSHVAASAPFLADRVDELATWNDVPLLSVRVNHLKRWCKPGLLFIGDAAHAMSPMGGVGINLAIQDAVAAANLLVAPLLDGTVGLRDLKRVQRRRFEPARITQMAQAGVGNRGFRRIFAGSKPRDLRLTVQLLRRLPALARLNGRLVGLGARPEHVGPRWRT